MWKEMKFLKIISLITTLLFLCNILYSECGNGSVWAYPSGKYISTKPVIILEGYSTSLIESTKAETIKLYLKNKRKKIQLIVKSSYKSSFSLELLYLTPVKPLLLGETYELYIEENAEFGHSQSFNTLKKLNPLTQKMEMKSWTVNTVADTIKPQWKSIPREISKHYSQMGCGPSSHVSFSFDANDSSEFFVRAKLTHLKSSKLQQYLVVPYKPEGAKERILRVGYGMCSGEFELLEHDNYKIEFDLIDFNGNETPWNQPPILFMTPPLSPEIQKHLESVNWQSSIALDWVTAGDTVVFSSQPFDSIKKHSIRITNGNEMQRAIIIHEIEEAPSPKTKKRTKYDIMYYEKPVIIWQPFGRVNHDDYLTINLYSKNRFRLRMTNYQLDKLTFIVENY